MASSTQAQPPANQLSTLSLIFAFIFAPAGAVLGHLGLSQIKQTGERGRDRAVIGIAVSYTVIALSVIALVVWAATGSTPSPAKTAAPGHPHSMAAPAPGAGKPSSDPDGIRRPLLTVEEVRAAIKAMPIGAPTPESVDFHVTSMFSALTAPAAQGQVDPAACEAAVFAGTETGLGDTGYTDVYGARMQAQGPNTPQTVTEFVVNYPDPAAAQQALTSYTTKINGCQPGGFSRRCTVSTPDNSMSGQWICGTGSYPMTIGEMTMYMVNVIHFDMGAPAPGPGNVYVASHIIASKASTVIDLVTAGTGVQVQASSMARAIAQHVN